jgi:mxaD protein
MKKLVSIIALFFSTHALAHGPTPIKVEETITIAAPPAAVWAVAGKFDGMASWHPGVKGVKATGGDAAAAEREVTFQNGATLKEGLDEYSAAEFKYGYRMSDPNLDALPISSYSVTLKIEPAASGGSEVKWYGRLYRGDTSNEPPENLNDDAARTAMSTFLREGLQGLKKRVEGK